MCVCPTNINVVMHGHDNATNHRYPCASSVLCLHCTEFVLLYVLCCDSWRLLFPFLSHTANPGGERDHVKGERDYMNDGRWI